MQRKERQQARKKKLPLKARLNLLDCKRSTIVNLKPQTTYSKSNREDDFHCKAPYINMREEFTRKTKYICEIPAYLPMKSKRKAIASPPANRRIHKPQLKVKFDIEDFTVNQKNETNVVCNKPQDGERSLGGRDMGNPKEIAVEAPPKIPKVGLNWEVSDTYPSFT